jgi:hypothetical protein
MELNKMKKLISLFIIISFPIYAQVINSVNLLPFVNIGNYNNQTKSTSFSVYSSLNLFSYDYLSLGFDKLKINNKEWNYDQSIYVIGYTKNIYPFYLSANLGYLEGEYSYKPFTFNYNDDINIYNTKATYNYNLFFISGSFSYLNVRGFKNMKSYQSEAIISFHPNIKSYFGASVLNTNQTDKRNLIGTEIFGSYQLFNSIRFSASLFFGERAYYFDPNTFTIFNQDDTQTGNYKFQIDYSVNHNFTFTGIYQKSLFETYSINYFSLGLAILIKSK